MKALHDALRALVDAVHSQEPAVLSQAMRSGIATLATVQPHHQAPTICRSTA